MSLKQNSSDNNRPDHSSYSKGLNKSVSYNPANIQSSFISSDDEALTIKTEKSSNKVKNSSKEDLSIDTSEEPLSEISNYNRKSKRISISSDDSDFKLLVIKRKRTSLDVQETTVAPQIKRKRTSKQSIKFQKGKKNMSFDENNHNASQDELISKILESNGKNNQAAISCSESDNELLIVNTKESIRAKEIQKKILSSSENDSHSSSDEDNSKLTKQRKISKRLSIPSSSSEDELENFKRELSSTESEYKENFKSIQENNKCVVVSEEDDTNKMTNKPKSKEITVRSEKSEDKQEEMIKVFTNSETGKEKKQNSEHNTDICLMLSDVDKSVTIPRTEKSKMAALSFSESDNELLAVNTKESLKQVKRAKEIQKKTLSSNENDFLSSHACSDEDNSKLTEQRTISVRLSIPSSSSEDELERIKRELSSTQSEFKNFKSRQEYNNPDSSDESTPINKVAVPKGKENSKKNACNTRIEHMKKYFRTAGIRIQSYDALFKNCKSIKSKVEKMLDILHDKGLKGNPTLKKCKKLRKKIETKKEVEELDTSNIIKMEGRPKRSISHNISKIMQSNSSSWAEKDFSHLKDIIDSEDSG